jgi:hypothetical protein
MQASLKTTTFNDDGAMALVSGTTAWNNLISSHHRDIIAEIYFNGDKETNVLSRIKNGISGILKNLPKF